MKHKIAVMAMCLVVAFMTACSSGGNNQPPGNNGGGASPPDQGGNNNAADPFAPFAETKTISIGKCIPATDSTLPSGDTVEDNAYTRYFEEQLNIKIETDWAVACGANFEQRVSVSIASGDLPDAMVVDQKSLRAMAKAGQLADISEAYETYVSEEIRAIIDSTNGFAMNAATFDGEMLALPGAKPGADAVHLMYIRQDWLDNLGLEVPRTIDELEEVARAFVERDPDGNNRHDTLGIIGPDSDGRLHANFLESGNNVQGFDSIFNAFDSFPGYWLEDANGDPVYGSILPETKEALAKLRDWYAEGLIDPEMGIRRDSYEPVINGTGGIFFAPWWMGYGPVNDMLQNNPEADLLAYAVPLNKDGEMNVVNNAPSTEFLVVRKGYEHPEVAIKISNLVVRDTMKLQAEYGLDLNHLPLRLVTSRYNKHEGAVGVIQEVLAGEKPLEALEDQPYDPNNPVEYEHILSVKLEPYDNPSIKYWNPEVSWSSYSRAYSRLVGIAAILDGNVNRFDSLIYSPTDSVQSRWANLERMETETFMRIIMGTSPLDAFDQFVEDWKREGGNVITAEVKEALNE